MWRKNAKFFHVNPESHPLNGRWRLTSSRHVALVHLGHVVGVGTVSAAAAGAGGCGHRRPELETGQEPGTMSEEGSEAADTVASGLVLLVNLSKVLLQKAQQDAEGRTL